MIKLSWPKYSANHAYVHGKNSRFRILKPEVRRWVEDAAAQIPAVAFRKYVDPQIKDIMLRAYYFAPDCRKRDTDNVMKLYKDVLQKAWGVDDSRFLIQEQSYEVDRDNPRIEIEVVKGELQQPADSVF